MKQLTLSKNQIKALTLIMILLSLAHVFMISQFKVWLNVQASKNLILELNSFDTKHSAPSDQIALDTIPNTDQKQNGQKKSIAKRDYKTNPVRSFSNKQKSTPGPININTASADSLQLIRGIGPVLSARIVKYRDKLGGFYDVNQIKEVYGIEDSTFNSFRKILIAKGELDQIDINAAGFQELFKHFYIDYNTATAILNYRDQHGPFSSVASLRNIIPLKDSVLHKVQPYLTVGEKDVN